MFVWWGGHSKVPTTSRINKHIVKFTKFEGQSLRVKDQPWFREGEKALEKLLYEMVKNLARLCTRF